MSDHTPENWRVGKSFRIEVNTKTLLGVRVIADMRKNANEKRTEADAKLMAAAPRLLKALRDLYLYGDETYFDGVGIQHDSARSEDAQSAAYALLAEFKVTP